MEKLRGGVAADVLANRASLKYQNVVTFASAARPSSFDPLFNNVYDAIAA